MKVEFLLAYDDNTWNTLTVDDVPLDTDDREEIVSWAERELAGQSRFHKVVLFAVYSIPEEAEVDDD